MTLQLTSDITLGDRFLPTSGTSGAAGVPYIAQIDGECIRVLSESPGLVEADRGVNNTGPSAHESGSTIYPVAMIVQTDPVPAPPAEIAAPVLIAVVNVTAAQIAEGATIEAIPALGAGKGPILVTADFLYLAGTVPFGTEQTVALKTAAGSSIVTGAALFDRSSSRIVAVATHNADLDASELANAAINLVIPAAGYAGGILTSELAAAGSGWSANDQAVVTWDTEPISAVNQGAKTFTVQAGITVTYGQSDRCYVKGSTGNDGFYTITNVAGNVVTVSEAIPSAVADGDMYHGSAIITVDTVDAGAIATYTLDDGGTSYRVGGDPYILAGPGGPGDDTTLSTLTVSEDSDGTGRLLVSYYAADLT